jgi:hypothetical protein
MEVIGMRSFVRGCGLLALAVLLLLSLASLYAPSRTPAFGGSPFSSHQMTVVPFYSSSSVIGPPSISASFIDRLLRWKQSPAVGLGSVMYRLSLTYRIDAAYVLAIFWHESHFGTTGEARVTFSPGNERCLQDRPCIDLSRGGYAQMQSWADGFAHLYYLLWDGYVLGHVTRPIVGHACTTIDAILAVFAPDSDGNNVGAYTQDVKADVAAWHAGRLWV